MRTPEQLDQVQAIVLPGGESTTISKLLKLNGLFEPIASRLREGMPVLGTCAGMILLAKEVLDGRDDQSSFAVLDVSVRRNGFGRQVASCEVPIEIDAFGGSFNAVFIRAPRVERVGTDVEVLASWVPLVESGAANVSVPVLLREGAIVASAFHPELSGDLRLHKYFLELVDRGPSTRTPAN